MNNTSQSSNRPIPPSLRPLELGSSYTLLRGLSWSPDAELAVATDDSVHVFVPRLIGSDGNPIPIAEASDDINLSRNGDPNGARTGPKSLIETFTTDTESRGQFTAHSRNIPIGTVPIPRGINNRLHDLQTPLLKSILAIQKQPQPEAHATESNEDNTEGEPTKASGTSAPSVLRGTWGMTSSVAEIAWSPAGVGRHSRSVLTVLTSSGTLVAYGERLNGRDDSGATIKGRGRQNYDTSQWETLWAVGIGAPLPGQDRKQKDRIISFAWAGKWEGPSFFDNFDNQTNTDATQEPAEASLRSLLVYMTDRDEVVVLAVFHVLSGDGAIDWQVMEVARKTVSRASPVTGATSHKGIRDSAFDVQCSSWFIERTEAGPYEVGRHVQTCLVGYIAGSYVGFFRISVQLPRQGEPLGRFVHLDDNVANGVCMDLLPNAFLRFEEGIWAVNSTHHHKSFICRAVVATPMIANELELETETRGAGVQKDALPPQVYPSAEVDNCTNPITGLVIHPPNPENRGSLLYTVVRSSCTSGNGTYNTTLPRTDGTAPQWADDITRRIRGSILASGSIGRSGMTVPHVRFCGFSQAPGGLADNMGVTAVLIEQHGAQGGIGSRYKHSRGSVNSVLFGWQDTLPLQQYDTAMAGVDTYSALDGGLTYQRPPVSTEAKMWTYMYGAGPPVVGRRVGELECSARVADLLLKKAASQLCIICDQSVRGQDAVTSVCEAGHKFARCSATGLAIIRPNASHACGVCGSRTMHLNMLLDILNDGAAAGVEVVDKKDMVALRQEVLGDVCKRCGGKFYD